MFKLLNFRIVCNRLFMIMETDETFSFEKKEAMDNDSPKVQEWEELMWKYQQPLPWPNQERNGY